MTALIGSPVRRIDGPAKVTGQARYSADTDGPVLYGALVTSTISAGRITAFDTAAVEAMPGVAGVIDHRSAPRLHRVETFPKGPAGDTFPPLQGTEVRYAGQPIGLVVAEDLGLALAAAGRVRVGYEAAEPAVMDRLLAAGAEPEPLPGPARKAFDHAHGGDPDAAWAGVAHRVEATYDTPPNCPAAMELHATVARWDGERLELAESTQWPLGVRFVLATTLGLPLDRVRVRVPYVGGGFGGKVLTYHHAVLTALAAKRFGRAVKTLLTRDQVMAGTGFRPRARQRIRLAADPGGRLALVEHDTVSQTSVTDRYVLPAGELSPMLYAVPVARTRHRLLPVNAATPSTVRAPGEAPGLFALESAVDELAAAMGLDPLALRLANMPERHPSGRPWSSHSLARCLREGAAAFGWTGRAPLPRARAEGDWWVGWGMAATAYGAYRSQAAVRLNLRADGTALASSATSEIGNGVQTAMVQLIAGALGLPLGAVEFRFGDTDDAAAPPVGASRTTASLGPAALDAARRVVRALADLARGDPASPLHGRNADDVALDGGRLVARGAGGLSDSAADLLRRAGREAVEAEGFAGPPELDAAAWETLRTGVNTIRFPVGREAAMFSFGAHFVEAAVHRRVGTVRVRRVLGRYAVGRVLNPLGAARQIEGGLVFGLGQALAEGVAHDPATGRNATANLADYKVPVSADMPAAGFDVAFLDEEDREVNELGAKSVGELGTAGIAAAVANAVHHACGARVRTLPITPDKLVAALRDGAPA